MAVINRATLRTLGSRRFELVPTLDDTGHQFRVRSLSELESSELLQSWQLNDDGKPDSTKRPLLRARLLQLCLVDENGDPIFGDGNGNFPESELDEILALDSIITQTVGDFLFEHLGMTGKPKADVEETVKN
jgi:hypothetical protein